MDANERNAKKAELAERIYLAILSSGVRLQAGDLSCSNLTYTDNKVYILTTQLNGTKTNNVPLIDYARREAELMVSVLHDPKAH